MRPKIIQVIVSVAITLLMAAAPCRADFIDGMASSGIDPLGLDKASKNLRAIVERIFTQLNLLETQTNNHVKDRIEQVHLVLNDVIAGNQATIDKAETALLVIEAQVNNDAIALIDRLQCSATQVMDQSRRAFANMVDDLAQADPSLVVFGKKIIEWKTSKIEEKDPDKAYQVLKVLRLGQLNQSVTDQSSAYDILSTYSNLEQMARLTLCFYQDQAAKNIWIREISDMERLATPWTIAVIPSI